MPLLYHKLMCLANQESAGGDGPARPPGPAPEGEAMKRSLFAGPGENAKASGKRSMRRGMIAMAASPLATTHQ